jgi:hypothetical protein
MGTKNNPKTGQRLKRKNLTAKKLSQFISTEFTITPVNSWLQNILELLN